MALSLSLQRRRSLDAIDATEDFVRPPRRHRRAACLSCLALATESVVVATEKAPWDAEKRTGGKGGGDGGTAPRRAALDSDEAEMGSRAGDADGDRRVLGDAACGDRGGGRASGSATAWAMRKEMSRLSSGVFFGFGCFTGSGVLRPMCFPAGGGATGSLERRWRPLHSVAVSTAFARPSSFVLSVLRPGFSEPGFADGRFTAQGTGGIRRLHCCSHYCSHLLRI